MTPLEEAVVNAAREWREAYLALDSATDSGRNTLLLASECHRTHAALAAAIDALDTKGK